MNNFLFGFKHIIDWNAIDHFLFILMICVAFESNQWKKILKLVYAFTIGHSLTLFMCSLDLIPPSKYTDFLIPLTIMFSAISNVIVNKEHITQYKYDYRFILILLFGMIHGLAFAGNFKVLIFDNESITVPLFTFNLGIEIGQILIILIYFIIVEILKLFINLNLEKWNIFISGIGFGISLFLLFRSFNFIQ